MVVAFTNHNDSPMGIMNGIILYHFQNQMIFLMLLILMLIRSDDGRGLDLSLGGNDETNLVSVWWYPPYSVVLVGL